MTSIIGENLDASSILEFASEYDFLDFGCSSGGNIKFVSSTIAGIRGLGIDIDSRKIALARESGHAAIELDILTLPDRELVDFVSMAHFLEHLPNVELCRSFLRKAVNVSRSFIHVRQPFFDCDGYLLSKGLKFYWSDWSGHRNSMTSLDFYRYCNKLLFSRSIHSFAIYGRGKIEDSSHEAIVPIDAPINSLKYMPAYGPKDIIPFEVPVYSEIVVDIIRRGYDQYRSDLMTALNRKSKMEMLVHSEHYQTVL